MGSANRTASKNPRDLSKSGAKESSALDTSLPQILSKPPTFHIQYETPDKGASEPSKPAFRQSSAASRDRNQQKRSVERPELKAKPQIPKKQTSRQPKGLLTAEKPDQKSLEYSKSEAKTEITKVDTKTVTSYTNSALKGDLPGFGSPGMQPINREIDWTPLMDTRERFDAVSHGYSFGSKKVNMGPAFLDLKVVCQCLARAIMRHLQFSKGIYMFLEDLQQAEHSVDEFSYKFGQNLKLGTAESIPKESPANFKQIQEQLMKRHSGGDGTFGAVRQASPEIEEDLNRDDDSDMVSVVINTCRWMR